MSISPGLAVAHEDDREASHNLARYAEQLKQLNRLSTTRYESLEPAFEDHLKTGCQLFGLPIGMILQVEGDAGTIRAVRGSRLMRRHTSKPVERSSTPRSPAGIDTSRMHRSGCCSKAAVTAEGPSTAVMVSYPRLFN